MSIHIEYFQFEYIVLFFIDCMNFYNGSFLFRKLPKNCNSVSEENRWTLGLFTDDFRHCYSLNRDPANYSNHQFISNIRYSLHR